MTCTRWPMREPAPGDRDGWAVYADWLKAQGCRLRCSPGEVAALSNVMTGDLVRPASAHTRLIGAGLCRIEGGWLSLTRLGLEWLDAAGVGGLEWVRRG